MCKALPEIKIVSNWFLQHVKNYIVSDPECLGMLIYDSIVQVSDDHCDGNVP